MGVFPASVSYSCDWDVPAELKMRLKVCASGEVEFTGVSSDQLAASDGACLELQNAHFTLSLKLCVQ